MVSSSLFSKRILVTFLLLIMGILIFATYKIINSANTPIISIPATMFTPLRRVAPRNLSLSMGTIHFSEKEGIVVLGEILDVIDESEEGYTLLVVGKGITKTSLQVPLEADTEIEINEIINMETGIFRKLEVGKFDKVEEGDLVRAIFPSINYGDSFVTPSKISVFKQPK